MANVEHVNTTNGTDNASGISEVHAGGVGPGLCAVICLTTRGDIGDVSAQTYGGQTLTLVDKAVSNRCYMWLLVNADEGNQTCVLTWTTTRAVVWGIRTYRRVHTANPMGDQDNSDNPAITLTGMEAGDMAVDVAMASGTSDNLSVGSGQTERWNTNYDAEAFHGGGSDELASGASVEMAWTFAGTGDRGSIALALNQSETGGTQIITAISKMRDMVRDMKRGMLPGKDFLDKYREMMHPQRQGLVAA